MMCVPRVDFKKIVRSRLTYKVPVLKKCQKVIGRSDVSGPRIIATGTALAVITCIRLGVFGDFQAKKHAQRHPSKKKSN